MAGPGELGNLLKQAQKMQAELDRMESELAEAIIEGVAGGGGRRRGRKRKEGKEGKEGRNEGRKECIFF